MRRTLLPSRRALVLAASAALAILAAFTPHPDTGRDPQTVVIEFANIPCTEVTHRFAAPGEREAVPRADTFLFRDRFALPVTNVVHGATADTLVVRYDTTIRHDGGVPSTPESMHHTETVRVTGVVVLSRTRRTIQWVELGSTIEQRRSSTRTGFDERNVRSMDVQIADVSCRARRGVLIGALRGSRVQQSLRRLSGSASSDRRQIAVQSLASWGRGIDSAAITVTIR